MTKMIMILAVALTAVGCASTSDLEALDAKVSSLETKVKIAAVDAADAKALAHNAAENAEAAKHAAIASAIVAQEVNTKLDRMFQKANHK
jgi:murein lipoprotein